jgi:hypothetical protein
VWGVEAYVAALGNLTERRLQTGPDGTRTEAVRPRRQVVGNVFSFSVMMVRVARRKTTVYIDEALLRAAKVAAARSGRHEYEVFEDALRAHLGLGEVMEQLRARTRPEDVPGDKEAMAIAAAELAAVRAERDARRAG